MVSICETLDRLGCQLADSRVTRLAGWFSGLVVANGPVGLTKDRLSEGFCPLRDRGCRVSVVPQGSAVLRHRPDMRGWMISYDAAAAPAALRTLAEAMGALGCEFVDIQVETTLGASQSTVVTCELDAPGSVPRRLIQTTAKESLAPYGIAASVFPTNMDDVATGEWPIIADSLLD